MLTGYQETYLVWKLRKHCTEGRIIDARNWTCCLLWDNNSKRIQRYFKTSLELERDPCPRLRSAAFQRRNEPVCLCLFICLFGWLVGFSFHESWWAISLCLSEIEMLMNLALYRNRHPQAFCFVVMENFLIAAWLAQLVLHEVSCLLVRHSSL